MKKISAVLLMSIGMLLAVMALQTTNAEETKTVAWYTANIREAKAKNQECHDQPNLKDSQECKNALHALEISFGVPHK